MTDSDRPSHGLTPVPFAAFVDEGPTAPKRDKPDTLPAPPPDDSSPPPDLHDEPGTLAGFRTAFGNLTEAIEKNSDELKASVEANRRQLNGSINDLQTLVVEHYQGVRTRLDAQAKAIRALNAETRAIREHCGMPSIEPLPDDL